MRIRSCRLDPGLRRRCRRAIPLASLSASSASPPSGFDHLISGPTVEIRKPASSSTITSGRPVTQTFERLTGDFRSGPVASGGRSGFRDTCFEAVSRCAAQQRYQEVSSARLPNRGWTAVSNWTVREREVSRCHDRQENKGSKEGPGAERRPTRNKRETDPPTQHRRTRRPASRPSERWKG